MKKTAAFVQMYLRDVNSVLKAGPKTRTAAQKNPKLGLDEYPFDRELLAMSSLYRKSRQLYVKSGGTYRPRLSSTERSLSATDLFKNEIEYTPSESEVLWFKDHLNEIHDTSTFAEALINFNGISVFHEQNHRILWKALPRAPKDLREFCRYLNFAESLIVMLDLALGDELGKVSHALERLKTIYRPESSDRFRKQSRDERRPYLIALFFVTYLILEGVDRRDIHKCLDYVLPDNSSALNKAALTRGFELSERFTLGTNREWQRRYARTAQRSLAVAQKQHDAEVLTLAPDPLDFETEFSYVIETLKIFGL
jgi:hypothetical protein